MKLGDIALIAHKDLDEIAATSLVEKKVKAIINTEPTISGKYPNQGPIILLESGIPIYEVSDSEIFHHIEEGEVIEIENGKMFCGDEVLGSCQLLDKEKLKTYLIRATKT